MIRLGLWRSITGVAAALCVLSVFAQTPRFDIRTYEVSGNSLLSAAEVEAAVAPHRGTQRDFGDIQRALEALEAAYRARGYSSVSVLLPEQEITAGTVRFRVVEARVARVVVDGNRHFSAANVRAALPSLVEGGVPNARATSGDLQLANENPARQAEVVLAVGEKEGELDATVKVTDEKPWRAFATLDNTGNAATGQHRIGMALQHANLFDRDHTGTLAWTTAPEKPAGVKVDIWSAGYRIPLYGRGESIEMMYAKSTIGTPSSSAVLGGTLGVVGKGSIGAVRWNHFFPRNGEYSSRLTVGLDYRDMKSSCVDNTGAPLTGVAGCVDYLVIPLSVAYQGRVEQATRALFYSLGVAANVGASSSESYDLASSNRRAPKSFGVMRLSAGWMEALPGDWQLRATLSAQATPNPLVPTEQLGLAGFSAVRGFLERAYASDRGYVLQLEAYTPDLAGLVSWPGNLRLLAFYDLADGSNLNQPVPTGTTPTPSNYGLGSAGFGARYQLRRDLSARFDLAYVHRAPAIEVGGPRSEGLWRAHFGLTVGF